MDKDEKDRLGDKLRDKERAEEERFFKEQEQRAIDRLRQQQRQSDEQQVPAQAGGDLCPADHGTWPDKGELEELAAKERESSWIGRLFHLPKRVV